MRATIRKITHGRLEPLSRVLYALISEVELVFFRTKWRLSGSKKPDARERLEVAENVTFIYKSFERQGKARRLCRSIRSYYPDAKIIIADDSRRPLRIHSENVQVIQLPFNSGLSYGLNRALELVNSPYTMRLDDDCLLTRRTHVGEQLHFLMAHSEIDLVGFGVLGSIRCREPKKALTNYYSFAYRKSLRIPRLTPIDDTHIVVEKSPNLFLARTDQLHLVGYDDNIRMIDHNEFFYRVAGVLTSVVAVDTVIFHMHNPFHRAYQRYRRDIAGDNAYIRRKYGLRN